jgi:hypothetical protein
MLMLPVVMAVLLLLAFWSALGCDSLRDFSYSRLEELCESHKVPERFGKVLKEQGSALLVLEFVLTSVTLVLSGVICIWIGWPVVADGHTAPRIGWNYVLEYAGFALLVLFFADVLPQKTSCFVGGPSSKCCRRFFVLLYGLRINSIAMRIASPVEPNPWTTMPLFWKRTFDPLSKKASEKGCWSRGPQS